jgi:Tfp pilus assembly protein PilF
LIYVLGSNYYLVNRTSEAIEQLEKAVQIDPNIAMAHIFLAINYFRERNYSKAAEAANQATRLDPKMARAYGLTPKEDLAEFLRG